jgi:hypothetical protein
MRTSSPPAEAVLSARSNFDVALAAEAKRCVRNFQPYTSEQRANHAASFRLGFRKRQSVGEIFWTHPAVPNIAFPTRKAAAQKALTQTESA